MLAFMTHQTFGRFGSFRATVALLLFALLSAAASEPDAVLPPRVDLQPEFARWNLRQKKQGARNTCSVFTVVAAMEFAVARKLDRGVPLSEEYLNWACNQIIGNKTRDRGQFFSDLLKGYERHGICLEEEMPYRPVFDPDYAPAASAIESAKALREHGLRVNWIKPWAKKAGLDDSHVEQVKQTLREGWPVCAGSYHSLLIVGYRDDERKPGGGEFLLRDSGGGNERRMSYETAKTRLSDLLWFDFDPGDRTVSADRGGYP